MATRELLQRKLMGWGNPAGSIRCPRCGGLMIVEESFDSLAGAADGDFPVRRCVQCGEVVDPVILQNRRLRRGSERERIQKRARRSEGN